MMISKSAKSPWRMLSTHSSKSSGRRHVGITTETLGAPPGRRATPAATPVPVVEAHRPVAPDGAIDDAVEGGRGPRAERAAEERAGREGTQRERGTLRQRLVEHRGRLGAGARALMVAREQEAG